MNKTKLIKVIEKQGWIVREGVDDIEICQYSPLGEDFFFTVTKNNIANDIISYAEDFDADEHATMWIDCRGKGGVPDNVRALIKDADDIKQMLIDLSNAVKEIL